ncbi:uncharacterized protein FIBRA_03940 [Fibroporia radiculosa]|uniref:SHSP domain-containing protein n=1 Tax=Fibroporia radiculosa TaxID=599839 RepID=J4H2P2_9APHY|nr:uncharacterized protein FIBRA_03940 [Fibroporia radiculosa]CCM01869.1 predicted protein [Fibroporia radiculosa]
MSFARHFFREMRPLFRMLEEPLGRPPSYGGLHRSFLEDPFFRSPALLQPAIDVSEEGDKYVIEAEIPGVKKENIQVRVGDSGRSVTIEGKAVSRQTEPQPTDAQANSSSYEAAEPVSGEGATAVAARPEQTQLSTERLFTGTSSFSRTVYLPRPIDTSNVSAKLNDGVLVITVSRAEDPATVQVPIE